MSTTYQRNLRRTGGFLLFVGAFMALMPFAGPALGVQFDSSPAWQMTSDRLVLHLLPGLLGMTLGGLLLYAAANRDGARLSAAEPRHLGWLRGIAIAAIVIGLWQGSGPWLDDLFANNPGALMFKGVPNFNSFSPAHQLLLEAICHWLPGFFTLIAGVAGIRLLRMHPQASAEERPRVRAASAG
jgi:hypothetical protein